MKLDERPGATTGCESYGPGHRLHWTLWKQATAARCVPVSQVLLDGTMIELLIEGRAPLFWHHHDPDGLREALDAAEDPILAAPQWQALRIDGYWFNCAPRDSSFQHCP